MGQDSFENAGHIMSNVGDSTEICFKVTAAADVAADGYTVNTGKDYVSGMTRTAEGVAKIALRKAFPDFLGLTITTSRADSKPYVNDVSSISDAADPHIHVTFREGAPADTDPDSAVMHFILKVKRTKTSFQAT